MWKFLSNNELGDLFEKLIEKKLTRKQQVEELEKLWKFLSENKLGDLFEKFLNISKDTIHNNKIGLEYAKEVRLLSVLDKVNIFPSFSRFLNHFSNAKLLFIVHKGKEEKVVGDIFKKCSLEPNNFKKRKIEMDSYTPLQAPYAIGTSSFYFIRENNKFFCGQYKHHRKNFWIGRASVELSQTSTIWEEPFA